MSEATLKQHLVELQKVLGQLQGDIETGPENKIDNWYDQILDVIFQFQDNTEDVIDARHGYDAESLEDEAVVESTQILIAGEEQISNEEQEFSDTEYSGEEELELSGIVYEDEVEKASEDEGIEVESTSDNKKTITININLKP